MCTRQEVTAIIAELCSKIALLFSQNKIEAILFGSYARGDASPTSDIDLRIDKGSIHGFELAGFLLELEDRLGVPVDLILTGSLDDEFLASIQNDELLLYEAS